MRNILYCFTVFCLLGGAVQAQQYPEPYLGGANSIVRGDNATRDSTPNNNSGTAGIPAAARAGMAKKPVPRKMPEAEFREKVLSSINELEVTVERVVDGDTFETTVDDTRMVMRLAGMDAPERGQENWIPARNQLIRMVSGQKLTVKFSAFCPKHPNGFFIVRAFVNGIDVGKTLLNGGWVWYDHSYGVFFPEKEHKENIEAMKTARAAKLGIWQNGEPGEPWKYFEEMQKENEKPSKP
jgi:micrococcal nuclease